MTKYDFDRKVLIYDSENVEEISYSVSDKHMIVRFKNATEYVYHKVPDQVFSLIIGAESVGVALRQLVTSFPDIYKYERID